MSATAGSDAGAHAREAVGRVFLVGAGPGDPGLLTRRGADCLAQAELLVYDRLIPESLLALAPSSCERVFAGKAPGRHALTQEAICRLLVEQAAGGRTVVRLKGGDPYVFGRGGEEAAALAAAGIPFEVVPGVSAAMAVPAYAGIPLTHRAYASSVAIVTGHEDPAKPGSTVDWARLATAAETLVVLMGVGRLPELTAQLIALGRAADTPAALVENGTLPVQRTLTAPLGAIADVAAREGVQTPATLVVGSVVALREQLDWFERRPLYGRRVLITRARSQASSLRIRLETLGAQVVEAPTIAIAPPSDPQPLRQALAQIPRFTWLALTSANAVEAIFAALGELGLDARALAPLRLAAVGDATAAALQARGLRADLVSPQPSAAGLGQALIEHGVTGRVLYPASDRADSSLAETLAQAGVVCARVEAYRTVSALEPAEAEGLRRAIEAGDFDAVTFASGSSVRLLLDAIGGRLAIPERTRVICIGPRTAAAAEAVGLRCDDVAGRTSVDGLVDAVRQAVQSQQRT